MFKFAISLVFNRLLILAVIFLFVNAYTQDNCRGGMSYVETIEHALQGWTELQRALP
jgi:hypothetical protein